MTTAPSMGIAILATASGVGSAACSASRLASVPISAPAKLPHAASLGANSPLEIDGRRPVVPLVMPMCAPCSQVESQAQTLGGPLPFRVPARIRCTGRLAERCDRIGSSRLPKRSLDQLIGTLRAGLSPQIGVLRVSNLKLRSRGSLAMIWLDGISRVHTSPLGL